MIVFRNVDTCSITDIQLDKEDIEDIRITDMNKLSEMPAVALKVIKERKIKTPIVCVSGVDFPESKKLCTDKIVEAFVLKDEREKFVSTIEKILKQKE